MGADDGSEQPAPRTIIDAFKTPKKYANVAQEELAGGRKLPFKVENPLDAVGSAIGSVGSFLKRNLPGDNDEKDRKHASAPPLAIDTTKGANVESLRSPGVCVCVCVIVRERKPAFKLMGNSRR